MERTLRRDLTDADLRELHAMANALMAEDFEHFRVQADSNDLVYVFRRVDSRELVGFQFWRSAEIALPHSRALVGGKLRIRPEVRNRGLHLLSGLAFFLESKARSPRTRFYRLSLASIFGFVSITEALATYERFDPKARGGEAGAVRDTLVALARESHYVVDEETGLFFVDIRMTPETLARYPARYFERPAARAYAAVNPEFRTNGCYAGFWFRFTPRNVLAIGAAIRKKLWRAP